MADIRATPEYLRLTPEGAIPQLNDTAPFKAVVVIDSEVTSDWQEQVSDWLVKSGCRYMVAWGLECSKWDDSVDLANMRMFDFKEVPDDDFVMTTWHENESLQEAFWFSEYCAMHPTLELERTYIVHIATEDKASELLKVFRAAQEDKG